MSENRVRTAAGVGALLLLALLVSCGDGDTESSTTGPGRTAGEVAALLVGPEALGDGWSTLTDPGGEYAFDDGVVTDENRDMLPRFEQCAAADETSQQDIDTPQWDAYRQLNLATGTASGEPTPGTRPEHHLVFVQEYLLADDPSAVTASYAELERGMEACANQETTSEDGETITSEPLDAPAVGDAATGLRYTVTEPGGGGAVWDLRTVAFRSGDLLVGLTVAEIATPTVDRVLDDAAFAEIVRATADATS